MAPTTFEATTPKILVNMHLFFIYTRP
jgi:hypothetical protein